MTFLFIVLKFVKISNFIAYFVTHNCKNVVINIIENDDIYKLDTFNSQAYKHFMKYFGNGWNPAGIMFVKWYLYLTVVVRDWKLFTRAV